MENGGTSIGIRAKDGVVLAVEKVITSKLLKPGANKRIATIDRHLGVVRLLLPRVLPLPLHRSPASWLTRPARARSTRA